MPSNNNIWRFFISSYRQILIIGYGDCDAELMVVMQEVDGQGSIKEICIGSLDNQNVKAAVVNTLEGGNIAFKM